MILRRSSILRWRMTMTVVVVITTLLVACKPGVPSKYIQPGKMEKLLYDYHVAEGMAMNSFDDANVNYTRHLYRKAVLDKYGVTQDELDSSLVYYYRHADQLQHIYENISKRLSDQALALGASESDFNLYGEITTGDTATIWKAEKTVILTPREPDNMITFHAKADSTFHKGDKLLLNFDSNFIYQEGTRDAVAVIKVTYANDSVAQTVRHLSSNTHMSIAVEDQKRIGTKEVQGFIILSQGSDQTSQTLKLLCLTNCKLVRMRTKDESKPDVTQADSTKVSADSVNRQSTPATMTNQTVHPTPVQPHPQPNMHVRHFANDKPSK